MRLWLPALLYLAALLSAGQVLRGLIEGNLWYAAGCLVVSVVALWRLSRLRG